LKEEEVELKDDNILKNKVKRKEQISPQSVRSLSSFRKRNAKEDRDILEQKYKEAKDFILRLNIEKNEREKRNQERLRSLEEKIEQEAKELDDKHKVETEHLLRKRREENLQTYFTLKVKREKDRKRYKELQQTLQPKDNYLYKKLEEKYKNEVLMPLLQQKKEQLFRKRSYYKPINRYELEEHIRKYESITTEKKEARENKLKVIKEKEQVLKSEINRFRTPVLERENMAELKLKEEERVKSKELKEKREKINNYVSIARGIHPVKISPQKVEELKQRVEQLKHPARKTRDTRKDYDIAKLNNKIAKIIHKGQKCLDTDTDKPNKSLCSLRKVDYLTEQRKTREESNDALKAIRYNWIKDLQDKNSNRQEKYQKVIKKAKTIEEQAIMREKMLRARGGAKVDPELGESVSSMLLNVIKAKIAALDYI